MSANTRWDIADIGNHLPPRRTTASASRQCDFRGLDAKLLQSVHSVSHCETGAFSTSPQQIALTKVRIG